jgi:acyl-[acyl carrier protein]--UDP-N-acetylglucosamine O-acyltransferase
VHREHVAYRLGYMGRLDPKVALSAAVHPTAQVGNMAEWIGHETAYPVEIGANSVIRPFVTIDSGVNRRTVVGRNCLVMAHVHIGHDVVIGDRVNVAPGAVICGCVTVGSDVKIGVNSCIRQHVTIGDGAVVGMGAVVVEDVAAGVTVVGNPARPIVRAGGGNDPMGVTE